LVLYFGTSEFLIACIIGQMGYSIFGAFLD